MKNPFSFKEQENSFRFINALISSVIILIVGTILYLGGEKLFLPVTVISLLLIGVSVYFLQQGKTNLFRYLCNIACFLFFSLVAILIPPEKDVWLFVYPLISTMFIRYELGLILSLVVMSLLGFNIAFHNRIVSFDFIPPELSQSLKILLSYIFVLIVTFIRSLRVNTYIDFLEKLSPYDTETGAYSRYHLEKEIEESISLLKRYDIPSFYIAVGVGKLRKIPPDKVPRVLLELVNGLKSLIRKTDIIGRYNRNLFIIQLKNTSPEKARPVVERIENFVKKFEKKHRIEIKVAVTNIEKDDTVDTVVNKLLKELKK